MNCLLFLSPPLPILIPPKTLTLKPNANPNPLLSKASLSLSRLRLQTLTPRADDGDVDAGGGDDDYEMEEEEVEELDNKKDYDVEYDRLFGPLSSGAGVDAASASADDIEMVDSESFVLTKGSDEETVVDYRINEDEFHKISLLHCDFFIRKPPDPDNNVYDFREMYVTPPDMDVYSIPCVLAPMLRKYIRCSKTDFGCYNVTEPPIDAPRDPLYKTEREIMKVFLTKHYRNRRAIDSEFVLDFEEIYVIDSKSKSITRAKVLLPSDLHSVDLYGWVKIDSVVRSPAQDIEPITSPPNRVHELAFDVRIRHFNVRQTSIMLLADVGLNYSRTWVACAARISGMIFMAMLP